MSQRLLKAKLRLRLACRHCWVDSENMRKGWGPRSFCVSDEHYVPTLLAALGLDAETDCRVRLPGNQDPQQYLETPSGVLGSKCTLVRAPRAACIIVQSCARYPNKEAED